METINSYLDYRIEKGTLYETDKESVLNMYTNLITYNYDEIFSSHQTILSKKNYDIHYDTENETLVDNLIDNTVYKMASVSASTITTSEISGTVHKTYVVHNNNSFKEYIIINGILEIYFQQQYHSILNSIVNNTVLIVPEILRYGLVNNDNKTYLFFEMPYYKPTTINIESNDNVDIIYEYNRLLNNCRNMLQSLNLIDTIHSEHNIFHNDISVITTSQIEMFINQILTYDINDEASRQSFYKDVLEDNMFNKTIDLFDPNIFTYNNQSCILIDFEEASRLSNRVIITNINYYLFRRNNPITNIMRVN
jgi:hypothetical protein